MMEINYELTKTDFSESSALAAKDRRVVFGICEVAEAISFGAGVVCCGFSYFLPGISLVVLSGLIMVSRDYGWKTIRVNKDLAPETDRVNLTFTQEGLEYKNNNYGFLMKWKLFSHFLEDNHRFVLIIRVKKMYFVVPKRAFANAQQINEARSYFELIKATSQTPPIAKPH